MYIIRFFLIFTVTVALPASNGGQKWAWVHCDRKFTGFYETDYSVENWENLGEAMKRKNFVSLKLFYFYFDF